MTRLLITALQKIEQPKETKDYDNKASLQSKTKQNKTKMMVFFFFIYNNNNGE